MDNKVTNLPQNTSPKSRYRTSLCQEIERERGRERERKRFNPIILG